MLRYIKHNLTEIDGVNIYPLISLLIFVLFFIVMFTLVIRMKKTRITELSAMPLEDGSQVDLIQELDKTN
jgi:cytochrome c oxidase cbb3-type subunit IV